MAYIGQGIKQGTFKVLDTSGNTYNGSNTTFNLGTQVGSAAQLLVSHDGVIQKAGTDYTLATGGTQITFSTAPASGASIFITEISGAVGGTVTPSDTSVTADKLNSALLTGHTDIGANIADADLFLTDDGAGGTLRKTAASRLKTYVGAGAGAFDIANLDIDGGTDIGADIADADLFIIDDGAGGTNRKVAASRIATYAGGTLVQTGSTTGTGSSVGVTNCFSSTYDFYQIHFYFHFANDTAALRLRIVDSGGERQESQYMYVSKYHDASNSGSQHTSQGESYIQLANSNSQGYDDGGIHGVLHVHLNNGHGTASHSNTYSMTGYYKNAPTQSADKVRAYYHASIYQDTITNHTATGFNFFSSSGNLEISNVKVYGLKGSGT